MPHKRNLAPRFREARVGEFMLRRKDLIGLKRNE
jgi:hypothetical protein